MAGSFFSVCDRPDGPLIIAEGYATSASIFEATGHAVACAMNCGKDNPKLQGIALCHSLRV